ncbi:MAG: hypothetical protein AABX48_03040 [Nanoarchaeota archaeon]
MTDTNLLEQMTLPTEEDLNERAMEAVVHEIERTFEPQKYHFPALQERVRKLEQRVYSGQPKYLAGASKELEDLKLEILTYKERTGVHPVTSEEIKKKRQEPTIERGGRSDKTKRDMFRAKVLSYLQQAQEGMSVREISDYLENDEERVRDALSHLTSRGWVDKQKAHAGFVYRANSK